MFEIWDNSSVLFFVTIFDRERISHGPTSLKIVGIIIIITFLRRYSNTSSFQWSTVGPRFSGIVGHPTLLH